ncbi:MAG: DoxX family protein [Enterobacterales bacterium]|nr:DoxX family protein [Enterobacterales bacterium]
MKIIFYVVLVLFVFLAVSSGITKIMLMPQEVEFFGQYGFSDPILIGFGLMHLVGGVLLTIPKMRLIGALIVATSFLISAIVLVLSGNIPLAGVTVFSTALLVFVVKYNKRLASRIE